MTWVRESYAYLMEFNSVSCIVRLIVAAILGGIIGFEREKQGRAAGLRTHILVCIGATVTVIVGLFTAYHLGFSNDPLRPGAQVISGIGFLGAGTILLRENNQVVGLTTAAGLWTTAAIGLVVGTGFYLFAIAAAVVVVFSMVLLGKIETKKRSWRKSCTYYLELEDIKHVQPVIDMPFNKTAHLVAPKSAITNHVGIQITIYGTLSDDEIKDREKCFREQQGVVCIICDNNRL